ncbi:hypothetical protein [Streptomyces sp. NPDC048309]|uniref:hypothetical protein n=1 Tax=Streptomyces sp. NPDC048309 TaxID=3154618 RepID=UPI0033E01971
MGAIVGALAGFLLSAATRKMENTRDNRIRADERQHEAQVRNSTLHITSLESLARAKRDSYKAKRERLEKILRDRQETFEDLTALRVLASESKTRGLPDGSAVDSFRVLPFSFVDEHLREELVHISVNLKVYSLMPGKVISRRRHIFADVINMVETSYLHVETERDSASADLARHESEGKSMLEEEVENLLRQQV